MDKIKNSWNLRRPPSGIRIFLRSVLITLGCLVLIAIGFVAAAIIVGLI